MKLTQVIGVLLAPPPTTPVQHHLLRVEEIETAETVTEITALTARVSLDQEMKETKLIQCFEEQGKK